jgi:small subunit ribosomal protein S16
MLVIRMQRTGRKGHAQFRIVVQDSRRTPTSGKVVAALGSYNPHTKTIILDKEKAQKFLDNGAQPSERAARLLKDNGVTLPSWVSLSVNTSTRATRNPEKRRSTTPAAPVEEVAEEAEAAVEETPAENPAEETAVAEEAAPEVEETPAA